MRTAHGCRRRGCRRKIQFPSTATEGRASTPPPVPRPPPLSSQPFIPAPTTSSPLLAAVQRVAPSSPSPDAVGRASGGTAPTRAGTRVAGEAMAGHSPSAVVSGLPQFRLAEQPAGKAEKQQR